MKANLDEIKHIQVIDDGNLVADQYWIDAIYKECELIQRSNHKFSKNYSPERLLLKKHLSFDILTWNEEIVSWSGLFNGGRYAEGVYRIMNRLYVSPKFRSRNCAYFPYARIKILPFQLARYQDRIRLLFLSREGLSALPFLRRWVKYNASESDWQISDKLVQVAPGDTRSCYQFIAFKKYQDTDWTPRAHKVEDWLLLPE